MKDLAQRALDTAMANGATYAEVRVENVRQRSRDTQKPLQNGHFSLCLCPTLFVLIRLQSPVLLVSVLVSGEQMFTFSILLRTEE